MHISCITYHISDVFTWWWQSSFLESDHFLPGSFWNGGALSVLEPNLAHLATAWIPSDSVRRSSKHSLSFGKSTFFAAHSSKSSEFGTEPSQIDMPICVVFLVSCDNCAFSIGLRFFKYLHLLNGMNKERDSRNMKFLSRVWLATFWGRKRMLLITRWS